MTTIISIFLIYKLIVPQSICCVIILYIKCISFLCAEDFVMVKHFLLLYECPLQTFLRVVDIFHENIMYSQSILYGETTMEIFQQDLCHKEYFFVRISHGNLPVVLQYCAFTTSSLPWFNLQGIMF